MKVLAATIVFFLLIGCANKGNSSSGILPKEKMQAVMWDIIGADVFTVQFVKKDSLKNAQVENMQLQNKIFALHNVSRAQYYKSFEYYISHSGLLLAVLDSMTAKAERERANMMQRYRGGQPK